MRLGCLILHCFLATFSLSLAEVALSAEVTPHDFCFLAPGVPVADSVCELLIEVTYDEPYRCLQELGKVTDKEGQLLRTFLSPAHVEAAAKIKGWMHAAGMRTWIDDVGNVHGRLSSNNDSATVLLIGSHYDTVLDAGKYDGALGIIAGIAAVKALLLVQLAARGVEIKLDQTSEVLDVGAQMPAHGAWEGLAHHIEVVAFSDEEGMRFQTTFLGSRALAGTLLAGGLMDNTDYEGVSVRAALAASGFDVSQDATEAIAMTRETVSGYIEVHLEQGPVLESLDVSLGVVSGIAGQTRLQVDVLGEQGHAGTVPMHLRKDPMAAAAHIIFELEKQCGGGPAASGSPQSAGRDTEVFLVCTVGKLTQWPGASNVIPGSVNFTVDIRSDHDAARREAIADFHSSVERICTSRSLQCAVHVTHAADAVLCDERITADLMRAVDYATFGDGQVDAENEEPGSKQGSRGVPDKAEARDNLGDGQQCGAGDVASGPPVLVSGAGHDALAMAELTGVGMVFVRCLKGISHSPLEHVTESDFGDAIVALHAYLAAKAVGLQV